LTGLVVSLQAAAHMQLTTDKKTDIGIA